MTIISVKWIFPSLLCVAALSQAAEMTGSYSQKEKQSLAKYNNTGAALKHKANGASTTSPKSGLSMDLKGLERSTAKTVQPKPVPSHNVKPSLPRNHQESSNVAINFHNVPPQKNTTNNHGGLENSGSRRAGLARRINTRSP